MYLHLQQSAIGGLPNARHNLGVDEVDSGNMDRAVKHWMISAGRGFKYSLENIRDGFMDGFVTKAEYETALREYQASIDEVKSVEREREKRERGRGTSNW